MFSQMTYVSVAFPVHICSVQDELYLKHKKVFSFDEDAQGL